MLVLSRREGEAVCVGEDVVVKVVRICGNCVGVKAENKSILRLELREKKDDDFENGTRRGVTTDASRLFKRRTD